MHKIGHKCGKPHRIIVEIERNECCRRNQQKLLHDGYRKRRCGKVEKTVLSHKAFHFRETPIQFFPVFREPRFEHDDLFKIVNHENDRQKGDEEFHWEGFRIVNNAGNASHE